MIIFLTVSFLFFLNLTWCLKIVINIFFSAHFANLHQINLMCLVWCLELITFIPAIFSFFFCIRDWFIGKNYLNFVVVLSESSGSSTFLLPPKCCNTPHYPLHGMFLLAWMHTRPTPCIIKRYVHEQNTSTKSSTNTYSSTATKPAISNS